MYQPNALGPYMLAHVDALPNATAFPAGSAVAGTLFSPVTVDATVRAFTASQQFANNSVAVGVGQQTSFGVAVDGSNPKGDLEDINAMAVAYQIVGYCRIRDATGVAPMNVNIGLNIGRADDATLNDITGKNLCANYMSVPITQHALGQQIAGASVQTVVLVGNFNAGITYSGDPIIVGWTVMNEASGTQTFSVAASLSIMKLTQVQHVFELRSN